MARARNLAAVAIALTCASAAVAQTPLGEAASRGPRTDVRSLRPSELVYQTTVESESRTISLGIRTVSVAPTMYGGSPAWLLLETHAGDGIPAVDSLVADLQTLRPIHWSSTLGRARVAAEFRGDSAFGGLSAPATRRSIVVSTPPGTLVSSPMLETVLRLFPLQAAWEDSTSTLAITLGGTTVLPTRISVIGEDNIRVPAGQFDCWVVSVHAGDTARGLYWVTKRDPIVVRSSLDVPTMGGAQLVSALTRIGR